MPRGSQRLLIALMLSSTHALVLRPALHTAHHARRTTLAMGADADALAEVASALIVLGEKLQKYSATLQDGDDAVAPPPPASPPPAPPPRPSPPPAAPSPSVLMTPGELAAARQKQQAYAAAHQAGGLMDESDAQWFQEGQANDDDDELPDFITAQPPPRKLYPGETYLEPEAFWDDNGDCLVDMPDWREARKQKQAASTPAAAAPPPAVVEQTPSPAPTLDEAARTEAFNAGREAAEALKAAARAEAEAEAAAQAAAAATKREKEPVPDWDGTVDEDAYFDDDPDEEIVDWRLARKASVTESVLPFLTDWKA